MHMLAIKHVLRDLAEKWEGGNARRGLDKDVRKWEIHRYEANFALHRI